MAEIERVLEIFHGTGDDNTPAINIAVRDTLTWVLGFLHTESLLHEYLVTGEHHYCFTCPEKPPEVNR